VDQTSQPNAYYLVTVNDANGFGGGTDWVHWYVQQSGTTTPPVNHTRVLFGTNFAGNQLYTNTYLTDNNTAPIYPQGSTLQLGGKLDPNELFMVAINTSNNVSYGTQLTWTFWVAGLTFNPTTGAQVGKTTAGTFSLDGTALAPEPATIGLTAGAFAFGLAAIHIRRRRQSRL
jgi:hypothetical protein